MHISFTPVRRDDLLVLSVVGNIMIINGKTLDFSTLADGASLPAAGLGCDWLASDVRRINGEVYLTLILPHGACAPPETLFPEVLHITQDGPISLPPHALAAKPEPEPEPEDML